MAQWVKDLALSLLSLWLLLRHGSIPDLGISACYGCDQKKKKKGEREQGRQMVALVLIFSMMKNNSICLENLDFKY